MKNIFNSVSIYFGKNSLLTNIRDKCVTRNTNLYFLDITKNRQVLASKVCHFQYDHRFLLEVKWGTLECACKEIHLKTLIKFGLSE